MKGQRLLAGLLLFLLPALAFAAEKASFATHFRGSVYFAIPVMAALEKDFWKEQGLEIKWLPFDSATTMVRAVAAGEVDAGTHGMDSLIIAASRGVPEVVIADPEMSVDFFFWVLSSSRIREARDLKGARIGVTRLGVSPHRLGEIAIRALGLGGEVKFVGLGGGGPMLAALKAGSVHAVSFSNFDLAALKAKGEVREVVRLNDYVPVGPTSQMIFAHRELVRQRPEVAKKAATGFLKGADFVMKNESWALARMKKDFAFSEEGARATFPMLRYSTEAAVKEGKIKGALEFLLQYGLLKKEEAPALEKLYLKGLLP